MTPELLWHKIPDASLRSEKFFPRYALRKVVINDRALCLAKTEKGIIAFDDNCPHGGYSLSKGWCNEKCITCPQHDIKFDLQTGKSLFNEGYKLRLHPVMQNENGLFVAL